MPHKIDDLGYKPSSALEYLQEMKLEELRNTKGDISRASALIAQINMTQHSALGQVANFFTELFEKNRKANTDKIVGSHSHYIANPSVGFAKAVAHAAEAYFRDNHGVGSAIALGGGFMGIVERLMQESQEGVRAENKGAEGLAQQMRQETANNHTKDTDQAKDDVKAMKDAFDSEYQSLMKMIS